MRLPFIVAPDPHGKLVDTQAWGALIEFTKYFKPKIRIINGDLHDFGALRKNAGAKDESDDLGEDIQVAEQLIQEFRPNHILLGNHDCRLWELENHPNAKVRELARKLIGDFEGWAKKYKFRWYPYDSEKGVIQLGNWKIVHGFYYGVNACRAHATVYNNTIFGHCHDINCQTIPKHGGPVRGMSIGCLCQLDQPYMNKKAGKLKWEHGWVYGFYEDRTAEVTVYQAQKINDKWYLPTEFREIQTSL